MTGYVTAEGNLVEEKTFINLFLSDLLLTEMLCEEKTFFDVCPSA